MKEKRALSEVTFNTEHRLANILALTKTLNITLTEASKICKSEVEGPIAVVPPLVIGSKLTTDEICEELDAYEIKVKIINQ